MRILQILHTNQRGGIETLGTMVEQGLTSHGFDVETIHMLSATGLGAPRKALEVAKFATRLLRDDHDAIIAYQATASVLTGVCGFLRGCQYRIVHQTAIPSETAWPVRLADKIVGTLGLYTANIANTQCTEREFRDYPATYRKNLILIVHGLDAPKGERSRYETRQRLGIPQERKTILNVGRLSAQKNQLILVDALCRVDDAMLVVGGYGEDADFSAFMNRATSLGVADRVLVTGPLPRAEILDLYRACDVFAFPSTWETFGLAAAEAAMAEIPLLVSDLPVLREVLQSTQPLVSFLPVDDVAAWAAAIQTALSAPPPPELRAEFSEEIRTRLSVDTMIGHYVELLRPKAAAPRSEP
ncbi:glycosyltransferase family 4 protein [Rhodopseudomonas sp. HC1]|uniref:glycosyltransferase family 4 protein n=1 Tax=Rhodopseudomonas infernalis TaxID=2897386 RepID=UPI001EE81954|nr:glycosyltransferase family 4 protein [Rhodopseudomonas infernalis]MCG6203120.1 glycosyltransferase family 4 protein [Rhodopseudomonas infernalis]